MEGDENLQRMLNNLFASTGDALLELNADGIVLNLCNNFQKTGLRVENFRHKHFSHIFDNKVVKIHDDDELLHHFKTQGDISLPLKSNTSEFQWGQFNLYPAENDRFHLHIRDITRQKKLEIELQNSTAEWTHAMDSFEDPIYILDLDERVLRANKAFYELKKLNPDNVIGRKITDIMHPDGEDPPCPVCVARSERRDTYITMEPEHPKNSLGKPYEIMIRTIRNNQGEPIGTLMGNRDLTRTRQTENELQRLNNHVALLMESTGEGIFGVDMDLNCTFVNRAAAKMLGYSREEMIGKNMFQLVHHSYEDRRPYPIDNCLIYRTINDGISYWSDEDVLWEKANISFPVQYRANPTFIEGKQSGAVVVFRNVTAARAMSKQMDYLARHDYLTGLYNRLEFEGRLSALIEDCKQNRNKHVLCYIDLDQFKIVNDTCGHIAGDSLLKQLAQTLKQGLSGSDTLARIGGDEFAILLNDHSLDSASIVVEEIFKRIRDFRFAYDEKLFTISASIGVVAIDSHAENMAKILSAADSACYLAKESGRNRAHVFQEDDAAQVHRHREIQWVARLKSAIEENRIRLYCQKIMPADPENTSTAIEILMRIEDENNNLILPGLFISAAERYDLMPTLDRVVIENIFDWLEEHFDQSSLVDIDFFTINISGLSISQDAFLQFLKHRLSTTRIPANMFCFEITETAAVTNLSSAKHFMSELKALGCRFALDDFGSGMSSFAYLKTLPVDYLKIDGNFIRDIVNDPVDNAMVKAINEVGHVMGLKTIAEYVEDDAISAELLNIGVDYLQGFRVGKPQPLHNCAAKRFSDPTPA